MLPIEARVDSLERAVECLSTTPPALDFGSLFGGGGIPFGNPNRYDLTVSLNQTLFTGGRISAQNDAADARRRIAGVELRATRAQLVLDVTRAYFDALLAARLVGIAAQALAQTEQALSVTRVAVEAGQQAEFDALRARVARDNQRAVVIRRRTQRDIAFARLKQLLDLPQETPLELTTDPAGELPEAIAVRLDEPIEIEAGALERPPAVQAAERVEIQEASVEIAEAQRIPDVSLSSQYGQVAFPTSPIPDFGDFRPTFLVALTAEVPIFLGGRIHGDKMVAEANLLQARARLEQTRELAALDTRTALEQLEAARAAWEASTGTVEQAQRAYAIAELRYEEGLSSLLELTDTRVLLQQARANRASAIRDLRVAQLRIALLPELPLQGAGAATGATAGAAGAAPATAAPAVVPPTGPTVVPPPTTPGSVQTTGAGGSTEAGTAGGPATTVDSGATGGRPGAGAP